MSIQTMLRYRAPLQAFALFAAAAGISLAAGPPPPSIVSPTNNATVQLPFTASWTAVTDSAGLLAYNWQVSTSSSFTSVPLQNSNNGQTTQATDLLQVLDLWFKEHSDIRTLSGAGTRRESQP
jgi:hypothetical protein